jgi:uncharacterized NAD(P)/FAD-binding protein YdhS
MRTFAIIGGGLSGTLVAIHLLRSAPPGTGILLIERDPPPGRGVAYGTECPDHRLNVIAGRMSLYPDVPDHFVDWVRARAGQLGFPDRVAPQDFLPRRVYGRYITAALAEARAAAASGVQFDAIAGEVIDVEESASGAAARLSLADGRTLEATRVLLALGHLPGEYPIRRPLPFYRSAHYVHLPWQPGALDNVGRTDDVLIVGAGLTAIDIAVQLDDLGHRGTVHALSRRGLRPLVHRPGLAPYPDFLDGEPPAGTVRGMVRCVRVEVRRAAAAGTDWRAVIDALRPRSQAIWQAWSWAERARFMRHMRPHWEVHRHRIAPEIAALIARMEEQGRLKFYAGRLQTLCDTETGAAALFRRRGTEQLIALRVAKVINCTGPRTDYSKYQHPLLINLLARGLIDHDPLALGIDALPTGEVLRYRSGPAGWLFTIGAPMKGVLWETTAVPEIRVQAKALAHRLLAF